MQRVQEITVDTPSGPLSATRWGDGPPVAVLLHAGVTDRRGFADVAARQRTGPLLAYDRRGFGATAAADVDPIDDLRAVMEATTTEPVWLVGSSQGGGVALRAALELTDRVRGLVLLSPNVPGLALSDVDADTVMLDEAADQARAAGAVDAVVVFETHLWLDGPQQPEGRVSGPARELFADMNRVVVTNELAADDTSTEGDGVDVWSLAADITQPVVVAAGEWDVPAIVERSRTLADRLPSARFLPLERTAHLPYLDAPGAVAELLADAIG